MTRGKRLLLLLLCFVAADGAAWASSEALRARIDADIRQGRPLVVHVVVSLCDNEHQGIVPVPRSLGNGRDPDRNLYWGAAYGVKRFLSRNGGWTEDRGVFSRPDGVLDSAVFHKTEKVNGAARLMYVVAEAWDGERMSEAIDRFFALASGAGSATVNVTKDGEAVEVLAGGSSHVVAFVGHNGLMDFDLARVPASVAGAPARGAVVLACASKPYFHDALTQGGSHPIVLTTGLMAPEAYTLEAIVSALLRGAPAAEICREAAGAYDRFQRCGSRAASRLFACEP